MESSNDRLMRAMKLIIFFSEMLPVWFMNHYMETDTMYQVLLGRKALLDRPKLKTSSKARRLLKHIQTSNEWSPKYLEGLQERINELSE